jgi:hydroxymethylbilane synthase
MLPIAFSSNRRALIVGGGDLALRAVQTLAAAGFDLVVVATGADASLRSSLERAGGSFEERAYASDDLGGAIVALAASDDDALNPRVIDDARDAGVLAGHARDLDPHDAAAYAAAARTLAGMRTYVETISPEHERAAVLRALCALSVEALAAMNPIQAEHEAESAIERLRNAGETPTHSVVCASRASALAMTQTRAVAARLAEGGTATSILEVKTVGDRITDRALSELGAVNVFVKELETALRERRADYAVHSCKDLPSELPPDMQIAAISLREDPRDAFCSERFESFDALPAGALVGTSSPRREAQLAALRPDLRFEPIRGNVDTRLRKLRDGEFDAIVLAMAGLNRLRLRATHTVAFEADALVPAVGQGALAIEVRAGDDAIAAKLYAALNDAATECCVRCERAALRELRMGCNAPVGIHATLAGDVLTVNAAYALPDEIVRLRLERTVGGAQDGEALGVEIGQALAARIAPSVAQGSR